MAHNASPVSTLEISSRPTEPTEARTAPVSVPRARLLVVDDDAVTRVILTLRLQRHGFEITEADGGRRALELILQQDFDLVLLDVTMPDLNGVEVLKKIREQHSPATLPVIMVTAKAETIIEALALGANDYVTKPVNLPIVLARANTQLGLKQAEEAILAANTELKGHVKELLEANRLLELEMANRERSQATSQYLAHDDVLTRLPNRVLFREQLEEAIARSKQTGETLTILFS